jgi:hypothetical protein
MLACTGQAAPIDTAACLDDPNFRRCSLKCLINSWILPDPSF